MIRYNCYVADSAISGKGLFAGEDIVKKSVIGVLNDNALLFSEADYNQEQQSGNRVVIQTGVRLVEDIFLYNKSICNEDYINHHCNPTMLYHCGMLFALKDIVKGDELTVDYAYFLSKNDLFSFHDTVTGKEITGLPSDKALLYSAKALITLYDS